MDTFLFWLARRPELNYLHPRQERSCCTLTQATTPSAVISAATTSSQHSASVPLITSCGITSLRLAESRLGGPSLAPSGTPAVS